MNRRTFAVAALAWVLVVTLGSGLVWAVVSRAGQRVVSTAAPADADSTPALGRATQAVGQATSGPSAHHTRGDDQGDHHGSGDGRGDDHPGDGHATSDPGGQGSGGNTGGSGSSGGTAGSGPTRSSSPAPDPGPTPVTDTWNGTAGSVKVTCTGSTIAYDSAYPSNGYRFEVGDKGPEHVEVEFENTATERQTKVVATCSSGAPTFRVETDSDSGSDD